CRMGWPRGAYEPLAPSPSPPGASAVHARRYNRAPLAAGAAHRRRGRRDPRRARRALGAVDWASEADGPPGRDDPVGAGAPVGDARLLQGGHEPHLRTLPPVAEEPAEPSVAHDLVPRRLGDLAVARRLALLAESRWSPPLGRDPRLGPGLGRGRSATHPSGAADELGERPSATGGSRRRGRAARVSAQVRAVRPIV